MIVPESFYEVIICTVNLKWEWKELFTEAFNKSLSSDKQ